MELDQNCLKGAQALDVRLQAFSLPLKISNLEYIFLFPSRNNTFLWCAVCSRYNARMLTYL